MQTVQANSKTMTKSYSDYKERKWQNFKEKLEQIKYCVDPRFLLEELGFIIEHETPKEIRAVCKIHGGDNKSAFRFNKMTKTWVCFTHKCHDLHGNDVIGLVKAINGLDFMGAVEWLKKFVGDVGSEADYVCYKREREMQAFVESYDGDKQPPRAVNDHSLKDFKPLRSKFFLKQGFKPETLDYFEIAGGWKDSMGLIRDIIPIRNDRGELKAYSLRDVRTNADDDDFKYILTPGFDKQNCLYNLNNAQIYSAEKPLIVVEGFKSVWRLHECGIKNVVAVMGSEITEGQQFLLCVHALNGIVIFFDNDVAGLSGTQKALTALADKMTVKPVFIQEVDENGKGLDPADLSNELIYEYLDTYY